MNRPFYWGVKNSAYQTEGAFKEGGKAESMWDFYSHVEGSILDGSSGDYADDFYHRYEDDINLMKELGVNSCVLSLSWSRIITDGKSVVSQIGLDYYSRVIDLLNSHGIEPIVELYDFNPPLKLQIEAGILSPEFPSWYSFYVDKVTEALGNKVKFWIPMADQEGILGEGYQDGIYPPYLKVRSNLALIAYRNLLRSFAEAEKIIKKNSKDSKIIITTFVNGYNLNNKKPLSSLEKDFFKINKDHFLSCPSIYLDPFILNTLPRTYKSIFHATPTKEDRDALKGLTKADYLGIDIDSRTFLDANVLYEAAKVLYSRYKIPLLITSFGKPIKGKSVINDDQRVEFLKAVKDVIDKLKNEGIPLQGFFYDSLLDSFEWLAGYSINKGLVKVDRTDLSRTRKHSFDAYQEIIKEK